MSDRLIVTIEIGSTMTKANAFRSVNSRLSHIAQGLAETSIAQGDVSMGVDEALNKLGLDVDHADIFINSSAAGGLKMTVHGLTPSMTARAAKEASLGAGAIVKKLTSGIIDEFDLDEIKRISPNLILLAGGVDFGERDTVIENARKLFSLHLRAPVIYAGNVALQAVMERMAHEAKVELWLCDNVFPGVDELKITHARRLIHEAFSKHIIHAPGMQSLTRYTSRPVIPTPGAVLLAAECFADVAGDTLVIDVGGATTDVHSVTDGSADFAPLLVAPEPRAKRTVEGDLGVYVNADTVLSFDESGAWKARREELKALPTTEAQQALTRWLTETAVREALLRHAGTLSDLYTPTGRKKIVKGKDLSNIQTIIGTGGALTQIPGGETILRSMCQGPTTHLLPSPSARILMDRHYIFSSLGTFLSHYRDEARLSIESLLCSPRA